MDSRIRKHAEVLINYSLKLQKGESLLINAEASAMPLITACYEEALKIGAHPVVNISLPELQATKLSNSTDAQLKFIHESEWTNLKSYDSALTILGTDNTRTMAAVPAEKLKLYRQSRAELSKLSAQRRGAGESRWAGTMFPAAGNAQDAGMSTKEYEEFVYGACMLNSEDPVAEWQKLAVNQQKIADFLNTKSNLRIVSEDTDLSMSIEGRRWVNCCGKSNFPDGEVFTGPVEDSVEGHIHFSFPGIYEGRDIEDICLTFEKGRVVKATAAKGQKILQEILDTDEGARRAGEFAIATNPYLTTFSRCMLFDEKIGGTVHLALGRSLPGSLGENESTIHWDMLCDMRNDGKIYADGELIYQNGQFLEGVIK